LRNRQVPHPAALTPPSDNSKKQRQLPAATAARAAPGIDIGRNHPLSRDNSKKRPTVKDRVDFGLVFNVKLDTIIRSR